MSNTPDSKEHFDLLNEFRRLVAGDCIERDIARHQQVVTAIENALRSRASVAAVEGDAIHWQLAAGVAETMCGISVESEEGIRVTLLSDKATCRACDAAAWGYKCGRAAERAAVSSSLPAEPPIDNALSAIWADEPGVRLLLRTAPPPTTPSDAAMRAAEELKSSGLLWDVGAMVELGGEPFDEGGQIEQVAAVISKHFCTSSTSVAAHAAAEEVLDFLNFDCDNEEVKQDISSAAYIITKYLPLSSPKTATEVKSQQRHCSKCGHDNFNGRYCEDDDPTFLPRSVPCGCVCQFTTITSPLGSAGGAEVRRCIHCSSPITEGVLDGTWVHARNGLTTCRKSASAHDGIFNAEPAAIITRHLPAAPAALCRASLSCRSGEGMPKVELQFSELRDAQAVHKWLASIRNAAATTSLETPEPIDVAIKEAEDDLRITCPEMFGGKPISYKRGSE